MATSAGANLRAAFSTAVEVFAAHISDHLGRCAACWADGVWRPYPCPSYRWALAVCRNVETPPEPWPLPQRVLAEHAPYPPGEATGWRDYPTGVYRAVITGLREL